MKMFRDYDIDLEEDDYDEDLDDEIYEDQEIVMDLGYGLYMAEAEGYLDTHESKVQKVLRDVRYRYNMGQEELTIDSDYLEPFGLVLGDLTGYDFERIQRVAETGRLR